MAENNSLKTTGLLLTADFMLCALALKIACWLRFGFAIPVHELALINRNLIPAALAQTGVLYLAGIYRLDWRYLPLRNLRRIMLAVFISWLLTTTVIFYSRYLTFSRVIIIYDHAVMMLLILSLRLGLKLYPVQPGRDTDRKLRCLVLGAGDAGMSIVEQIRRDPNSRLDPVAFLDDDPAKRGQTIAGVPVLAAIDRVSEIACRLDIGEVLISIPSAGGDAIRRIVRDCQNAKLKFRIIPGLKQIIDGSVTPEDIRYFEPEDLLGRETVEIDQELFQRNFTGQRILVTGAAGSIGRELVRQLLRYKPARLAALDQNETGIFELSGQGNPVLQPYLADINDRARLTEIFQMEKPDYVFHAAAYKHVPVLEQNIGEAVKNNIIGTINLIRIAADNQVKKVMFISTDKAVGCESIMGMSKRIGEKLMVEASREFSGTVFAAVRFGNVLSSSGSVVPIFIGQIKAGGPVTVTHPDMERFFMTIPEACSLVLQAAVFDETGSIYVLDMGTPVKIVDLARNLITLYGKPDIAIKFTGIRPGEKMEEKLFYPYEQISPSGHSRINKAVYAGLRTLPLADLEVKFGKPGKPDVLADLLRALSA